MFSFLSITVPFKHVLTFDTNTSYENPENSPGTIRMFLIVQPLDVLGRTDNAFMSYAYAMTTLYFKSG